MMPTTAVLTTTVQPDHWTQPAGLQGQFTGKRTSLTCSQFTYIHTFTGTEDITSLTHHCYMAAVSPFLMNTRTADKDSRQGQQTRTAALTTAIWLLYHHNAMNTEGGLKDSSTNHCYMAAVSPFAMNTEGGLKGGITTAIWLLYHHLQ